jgi:hypothetical protein
MVNSTMNSFEFKAIPTFGIRDYKSAIDFYVDFLGFQIDWEHRFELTGPVYMQISKSGLILHLSESKRFEKNVIVFVETKNLIGFHKELQERNPKDKTQDVLQTKWKTLQLEIQDPFGNLLRFNENLLD